MVNNNQLGEVKLQALPTKKTSYTDNKYLCSFFDYFFLLKIQSFSHGIGNFIFTFCPFTPGLTS